MNERIIELEDIAANDFFGPHHRNMDQVKKYFPKVKIVARGNKVRIYGEPVVLDEFEKKFETLVKYYNRYNKLDDNSIERLLSSHSVSTGSKASEEVLVHGVSGKQIKALSVNQRRMVDKIQENDMLFAVGPAGCRFGHCRRLTCLSLLPAGGTVRPPAVFSGVVSA